MNTGASSEEREALLKDLAGQTMDAPEGPPIEPAPTKDQSVPAPAAAGEPEAANPEEAERPQEMEQAAPAKPASQRAGPVKSGYTPEQYEALARQFETEGRPDLAKMAGEEASRLRSEESQRQASQAREALVKAWSGNLSAMLEKHAELKNPQSEMHRRVDELLKKRPVLFSYPEGILDAVDAVKAYITGARAGALEKEVAALKQQLAEKERLLQPAKGGPAVPSRAENFDELPLSQQRAALMREMQSADSGA